MTTDNKTKKVHKIVVDKDKCTGAATCIVVAPQAYELDSNGIAIVKNTATEVDDETLIQSAQSCPVQAIELFDESGKKII